MVNSLPRDHPFYARRYQPQRRLPPMEIDEALRTHCFINLRQCFVAGIDSEGQLQTFVSPPQQVDEQDKSQFFDGHKFVSVMQRREIGANPIVEDSPNETISPGTVSATTSRRSSELQVTVRSTRDRRPTRGSRRSNRVNDPAPLVRERKFLTVSDSAALWEFYKQSLCAASQASCKIMAKVWIKAFEPRKQTNHPYTGSDSRAPDWWPRPWGHRPDQKVRHKEPDHILKYERVHLLAHMLRMVIEPRESQQEDVQKMNLNVEKLREITFDSMAGHFAENPRAKTCLSEMLCVARAEERCKAGELPGSSRIGVGHEHMEDTDNEDEEEESVKEEDDDVTQPNPATSLASTHAADQNPPSTTLTPPGQYLNDLPAIRSHFGQPMMPDMHTQHHQPQPAVSPNSGPMALDMVQSPHDTSRRASMFNDYAGAGANTMQYQTPWQPASAAATMPPIYSYATAPGGGHQPPYVHAADSMGQGQGFMNTGSEGLPRHGYDPTPTNAMFRGNSLAQAHGAQTEGYSYIQPESRGVRGGAQEMDTTTRNHLG